MTKSNGNAAGDSHCRVPVFVQRQRQEDMDVERILKKVDFSKTSLIREQLWEKMSEKSKEICPTELLVNSLSHGVIHEAMRAGSLELTDEALDEIAAAGFSLHGEHSPKTGEGEKR